LSAKELEAPIEGPLLGRMPVPNPRAKVEATGADAFDGADNDDGDHN